MDTALLSILVLAVFWAVGTLLIERWRRRTTAGSYSEYQGPERRRLRLIRELDPTESSLLGKIEEFVEKDTLTTHDGLKLIIKIMQDLYLADHRRTLKVNEVVEKVNILEKQSLAQWVRENPKMAWFILTLLLAFIVDEIRAPLVRLLLQTAGVPLP